MVMGMRPAVCGESEVVEMEAVATRMRGERIS
jgi:hypothetical protein